MATTATFDDASIAEKRAGLAEPASEAPAQMTGLGALEAAFKAAENGEGREKFLPVTRYALMDRLTQQHAWPAGLARHVRRYFRYADAWRQVSYNADLLALEQAYEPFSPDSDLLITRKFSDADKRIMQRRLMGQVEHLLVQANYTKVDSKDVEFIMTKDSYYGLDLHVDLDAFEEIMIFFRGAISRTETRRSKKKLYLRKEKFEVPIFQRLFMLFKLKPEAMRIREIAAKNGGNTKEAEKYVKKMRALLPPQVKDEYIYLKLFKNIPRTDVEMIFPNTRIKFRMFDKVKLGMTAGGGLGVGAFSAAGKLALAATSPLAAAGAALGLGGVAIRQGVNFMNQKNKYMAMMAQNLYFHAMADNRGAMTLMADRASEEDIKEEMLLYAVLAKERVHLDDISEVDKAIEQYLLNTFDLNVDFDVSDALRRLLADGIVIHRADGFLETLEPEAAALHIDKLWDSYLDNLPDPVSGEGFVFDAETEAPSQDQIRLR